MGAPAKSADMEELLDGIVDVLKVHLSGIGIDAEILLMVAPVGDPQKYTASYSGDRAYAMRIATQFRQSRRREPSLQPDERALLPAPTTTVQSTTVEEEPPSELGPDDILANSMEFITTMFEQQQMAMNCFVGINYDYLCFSASTTGDSRENNAMLTAFVYKE
jgi:hypothetical protein